LVEEQSDHMKTSTAIAILVGILIIGAFAYIQIFEYC